MNTPFEPMDNGAAAEPTPEAPTEALSSMPPKRIAITICGVGGAGCNALEQIAQAAMGEARLFALNTDAQALERCEAPQKLVLGAARARGLGAGGDPAVGRAAAEEDVEKLREMVAGSDLVFVIAGLGGGTGTGAAPVLARVAREAGALVLGVATMPFDFEGGRRHRQAELGLQHFKAAADAVICLPNQKVFQQLAEKTGMQEGMKIINGVLADGLRAIWQLLTQTGLINVDFADLCSVLRERHAASSFATAEAAGENRCDQITQKLFAHPLLDEGQLLAACDAALVSIIGGPDLTMTEVSKVMEPINRQAENAHVIFGAVIDQSFAGRLSVTLIASRGNPESDKGLKVLPPPDKSEREETKLQLLDPGGATRRASRYVAPAPEWTEERKEAAFQRQSGRNRKRMSRQQTELALEIVPKGRFDQSEPTIHHGEDLDVPTYVRRGVALN